MDFLDSSIIPSLPAPGGMVSHTELMGRPRIILPQVRSLSDSAAAAAPDPAISQPLSYLPYSAPDRSTERLTVPQSHTADIKSTAQKVETTLNLPVPGALARKGGVVKRAISFDSRANKAGIGSTGLMKASSATKEDSNGVESDPGHGQAFLPMVPARPTRSVSPDPGRPAKQPKKLTDGVSVNHGRTMSDTSNTSLTIHLKSRASTSAHQSARQSTLGSLASEEPVQLGTEDDHPLISRITLVLHSLCPPERATTTSTPQGRLDPSSLLIPLAITLEALVVERSVLRDDYPSDTPRLPASRDGSALQMVNGEGELDWDVVKKYILALGGILDDIMPFLRNAGSKQVEGLTKNLRMYVGKMKKVFGEIAGMYVEGYSFMRGWWDEDGMKGAAGEVGRWGDLFDA